MGEDNLVKKTVFYDREGRPTTPDKAVRAEITYYTKGGKMVERKYYDAVGRKP